MQCNQSYCGVPQPVGFPNSGPYYPCNQQSPCPGPLPEVIGEGEVTSIILPDGSTQFFFMPTMKWSPPSLFTPSYIHSSNPYMNTNCNSTSGIWLIRKVSNPISQPLFGQQSQIACGYSCPNSYQWSISYPSPIKFHNDSWTSTTDLRYFFPRMRAFNAVPRACAGVQVSVPTERGTDCHDVVCDKCGVKKESAKCKCNEISDSEKKVCTSRGYKEKRSHHKCECYSNASYSDVEYRKTKPNRRNSKNRKTLKKGKERSACECYTSGSETVISSQSDMSVDEVEPSEKAKIYLGKGTRRTNKKKDLTICECYRSRSEKNTSSSQSLFNKRQNPNRNRVTKGKPKYKAKGQEEEKCNLMCKCNSSRSNTNSGSNKSSASASWQRTRKETRKENVTSLPLESNQNKESKMKSAKDKMKKERVHCECHSESNKMTSNHNSSLDAKHTTENKDDDKHECCGTKDEQSYDHECGTFGTNILKEQAKPLVQSNSQGSCCKDPLQLLFPKTSEANCNTNQETVEDLCDCCRVTPKEKRDYYCECALPGPDTLNKVVATVSGNSFIQSVRGSQVSCYPLEVWIPKAHVSSNIMLSASNIDICSDKPGDTL